MCQALCAPARLAGTTTEAHRSTAMPALVLSMLAATAGAEFEDTAADRAEGWWSRPIGSDDAQLHGYADRMDSALDGAAADELQRRGYGDVRTDWEGAKQAFFSGDTDALRGYADRVDGALSGGLGAELDESGYGSQARTWWERLKGWLFGGGEYRARLR